MKENNFKMIKPLMINNNEKDIINDVPDKKEKKFDRIIISYNFKKNSYFIADNELDGYENKEFVLNTLYYFNNKPLFKFDSLYNPTSSERMIFLIPVIIIFILIIYILYALTIICTLNPLIIYIAYLCIKIVLTLIKKWRNNLYEKFKKKAINNVINETNNSQNCTSRKIQFKLGLSGYWLEIEKTMSEDNELKKLLTD